MLNLMIFSYSFIEVIFIIMGLLAILILTIVLVRLIKRKPLDEKIRYIGRTHGSKSKINLSYEKLQIYADELMGNNKKLTAFNNILTEKVKKLEKYSSDLEETNRQLVIQKEKLKKSKERLEDLQKRKATLYAMAIHDLKSPAGAIKGYVDLLTSYDLNAMEQQEIMENLVWTSSRIITLAQQLSSVIAQTEDENSEPELMKSSIKKIIDAVVSNNYNYARTKKIKIVNLSSPDLPQINIDPFKIEEVIDNLINNAIKFANKDATVWVRSYSNLRTISVEVEDNGPGIPENELIKVFSKGVLSNKPTGGESSSGLGLWLVKKIIDEHGGRIWVESKVNNGSKFIFELPINN